MNNCVGAGNLKHFFLFLVYTWSCSVYCLLRSDGIFNVNDANYFRLLLEFSAILEILKTRLPGNVVANIIFQLGLPPPMVEGFRLASTRNEFEDCLKNLIQKNIARHKSTPR